LEFTVFDLDIALARIRQYALDNGLTAEQVEDSFLAGVFAAHALQKDWFAPGGAKEAA